MFAGLPPRLLIERPSLFLQLRVIRAFKSTLEDLEERRSVHSLHSLHSMRSSRSHTGPRPLSDFTYIDEDPTNPMMYARSTKASNAVAPDHSQDSEASSRGSRLQSVNSPASPLLLSVPGSAAVHNNHHHHHHTNNNRTNSSSSNAHNQSPNHTLQTSRSPDSQANSPSAGSTEAMLPDLPKLVHETSI